MFFEASDAPIIEIRIGSARRGSFNIVLVDSITYPNAIIPPGAVGPAHVLGGALANWFTYWAGKAELQPIRRRFRL